MHLSMPGCHESSWRPFQVQSMEGSRRVRQVLVAFAPSSGWGKPTLAGKGRHRGTCPKFGPA